MSNGQNYTPVGETPVSMDLNLEGFDECILIAEGIMCKIMQTAIVFPLPNTVFGDRRRSD